MVPCRREFLSWVYGPELIQESHNIVIPLQVSVYKLSPPQKACSPDHLAGTSFAHIVIMHLVVTNYCHNWIGDTKKRLNISQPTQFCTLPVSYTKVQDVDSNKDVVYFYIHPWW